MINILRLQAELHDLEQKLQDVRTEDSEAVDTSRPDYVKDFWLMNDESMDDDGLQLETLQQIGTKLNEYSDTPRIVTAQTHP